MEPGAIPVGDGRGVGQGFAELWVVAEMSWKSTDERTAAYTPREAPCCCRACMDPAQAGVPLPASRYEAADAFRAEADLAAAAALVEAILDRARGHKGPAFFPVEDWPALRALVRAAREGGAC